MDWRISDGYGVHVILYTATGERGRNSCAPFAPVAWPWICTLLKTALWSSLLPQADCASLLLVRGSRRCYCRREFLISCLSCVMASKTVTVLSQRDLWHLSTQRSTNCHNRVKLICGILVKYKPLYFRFVVFSLFVLINLYNWAGPVSAFLHIHLMISSLMLLLMKNISIYRNQSVVYTSQDVDQVHRIASGSHTSSVRMCSLLEQIPKADLLSGSNSVNFLDISMSSGTCRHLSCLFKLGPRTLNLTPSMVSPVTQWSLRWGPCSTCLSHFSTRRCCGTVCTWCSNSNLYYVTDE